MFKRLSLNERAKSLRLLIATVLIASLSYSTLWFLRRPVIDKGGSSKQGAAQTGIAPENAEAKAQESESLNPKQLSDDKSLMTALVAARYGLERRERAPFIGETGAGYLAMSHEQNLNAWFNKEGITIRPTVAENEQVTWRMGLRLAAYGYGEKSLPVPSILSQTVKENRIEYERAFNVPPAPASGFEIPDLKAQIKDSIEKGGRPRIVEWYENNSEGIEQGFTLDARPLDAGKANGNQLRLALAVTGDLHARVKDEGQAIELLNSAGSAVLSYSKLVATDAEGKQLSARMRANEAGDEIALEVDDSAASYPITIDPVLQWVPGVKLTASDGDYTDHFGYSVDIQGDTIVVGAKWDDVNGKTNIGSAYIFTRKGGKWKEQTPKLLAPDGKVGDEFGSSVAISGNTIIVGAPKYTIPYTPGSLTAIFHQGAVYVFTRKAGAWVPTQKLLASDNLSESLETSFYGSYWNFGTTLDIEGDTIVVGSPHHPEGGAAYVFARQGTQWSEGKALEHPDAGGFGWSVSISGHTIGVGAPGTIKPPLPTSVWGPWNIDGAVYFFTGSGLTWSMTQKLYASDARKGDGFGSSVAISGNTAIVGATGADHTPPEPEDVFGSEEGAAYILKSYDGGATWNEKQKLWGSGGDFGRTAAISGSTAIVCAPFTSQTTNEGGQEGYCNLYVSEDDNETFNFLQSPIPDVPENFSSVAHFGRSVAISGGTAVIGAYGDDSRRHPLAGAAYTFQSPDTDGDGLLDAWELNGITFRNTDDTGKEFKVFIDLPKMGANPLHKDVFVHVDWMRGEKPTDRVIKMVVDAFANAPANLVNNPDGKKGINLHVDLGLDSIDYVTKKKWGDKSKANEVPYKPVLGTRIPGLNGEEDRYDWEEFDAYASLHFESSFRQAIFHYALFVDKVDFDAGGMSRPGTAG